MERTNGPAMADSNKFASEVILPAQGMARSSFLPLPTARGAVYLLEIWGPPVPQPTRPVPAPARLLKQICIQT